MSSPVRFPSTISTTPANSGIGSVSPNKKTAIKPEIQFSDALDKAASQQSLKFSNHAIKRLETRNIALSQEEVGRLENAVQKAEKRGGKESLVLMDELAFIVNVRERLVVTAMDTQNRGEGVFTHIDSVVLADPSTGKNL